MPEETKARGWNPRDPQNRTDAESYSDEGPVIPPGMCLEVRIEDGTFTSDLVPDSDPAEPARREDLA